MNKQSAIAMFVFVLLCDSRPRFTCARFDYENAVQVFRLRTCMFNFSLLYALLKLTFLWRSFTNMHLCYGIGRPASSELETDSSLCLNKNFTLFIFVITFPAVNQFK